MVKACQNLCGTQWNTELQAEEPIPPSEERKGLQKMSGHARCNDHKINNLLKSAMENVKNSVPDDQFLTHDDTRIHRALKRLNTIADAYKYRGGRGILKTSLRGKAVSP